MDSSNEIAQALRCHVVAPAGSGKTFLIAKAVATHARGRELILTHTHAGVHALRKKLHELGARASQFQVDTIASWSLHYAAAYPKTSGLSVITPKGNDWKNVYQAARILLGYKHIEEVVRASYCGIYVDEYQDCTIEQHEVILRLATILPCRVLGDPLQGIFGFGGNVLVDWKVHVAPAFPELSALGTPWRWQKTSPKLGQWLSIVRQTLIQGTAPIDLRTAPKEHVRWIRLPLDPMQQFLTQTQACKEAPKGEFSTVAIHNWEGQCKKLVNRLAPMYCNIETIECKDLLKSATALHSATGAGRVDAVVDFLAECLTGVRQEFKTVIDAAKRPLPGIQRKYKHQEILIHLQAVGESASYMPVLAVLEAVRRLPC